MNVGDTQVVIGKRVNIGAAVKGLLAAYAALYPEYAAVAISIAIPITFAIQIAVAHYAGVTTKDRNVTSTDEG